VGKCRRQYILELARLNKPLTWFILAVLPGCIPMAMVGSEPPQPAREVKPVAPTEIRTTPLPVSKPPVLEPVPAELPVANQLFIREIKPAIPLPNLPILTPADVRVAPDMKQYQTAPTELNALLQQIESRNFDNLSPDASKSAANRLREVARRLEQRQPLSVARVTLARSVDAKGTCHPWPAGHLFRPGRGEEPGDRLLTYLEIDHLKHHSREGREECTFNVRLELRDRTTIKQSMSFPARVVRQRADSDSHWLTLCFHLPGKLNPGPHSLMVEVEQRDEPAPRLARKSVDFLVGLGPDSEQNTSMGSNQPLAGGP
jgi:hypothetical protein